MNADGTGQLPPFSEESYDEQLREALNSGDGRRVGRLRAMRGQWIWIEPSDQEIPLLFDFSENYDPIRPATDTEIRLVAERDAWLAILEECLGSLTVPAPSLREFFDHRDEPPRGGCERSA
jgi:hypothetical protein